MNDLETNGLITDFEISWGSLLLLAAKPHQESCDDDDYFIWILCVNHLSLNIINFSFEVPIPRCAHSVEDFNNPCGSLFTTSLDARSGYH